MNERKLIHVTNDLLLCCSVDEHGESLYELPKVDPFVPVFIKSIE
jgi:hypothetical protein